MKLFCEHCQLQKVVIFAKSLQRGERLGIKDASGTRNRSENLDEIKCQKEKCEKKILEGN